jgi:hypothetical protein
MEDILHHPRAVQAVGREDKAKDDVQEGEDNISSQTWEGGVGKAQPSYSISRGGQEDSDGPWGGGRVEVDST